VVFFLIIVPSCPERIDLKRTSFLHDFIQVSSFFLVE
jgi:hypothetical protein